MNANQSRRENGRYKPRKTQRHSNNPTSDDQLNDNEYVSKLSEFVSKNDLEGLSDAVIGSQKFIAILNSNLSDEMLCIVIGLVALLIMSNHNVNKNYIIKVVMTPKFIERITSFLTDMATKDKTYSLVMDIADDLLQETTTILETALDQIPMTSFELVKTVLKSLKAILSVLKAKRLVNLSKSTEREIRIIQNRVDEMERIFEKQEFANDDSDCSDSEIKLLDSYRKINIFPENSDILVNRRSLLRKNIIDRPYSSVSQYLDIHFRLLREDFINPIREDICDYRRGIKRQFFNIKIHDKVIFLERSILRDCRAFKIQFHVPQWMETSIDKGERQKRFLNGTLLLFTNNNFKTMIYGKVVETKELKNGRVLVDISNGNPQFDQSYIMIECVLFFEPYHQVLKVFQKVSNEHLPMEDYIINIITHTYEPEYMEDVDYVNDIKGLNPSQKDAHYAAMTREFVIIQGPPGTGKTFLGKKIVEEILKLREYWHDQGPILIICVTNHALDQFLDGIRKMTDRIARLGGKSNAFLELSTKFGPESIILDLLDNLLNHEKSYYQSHDFFCHEDKCNIDCDYKKYRKFLGILKSDTIDYNKCPPGFRHKIRQVPFKVRKWLKEKKVLTESNIGNKHAERDVRVAQKSMHTLKTLKSTAILKTSIIFADQHSELYYHFNNFQLAGWLLCDDGTVKSNWETVDNIGKSFTETPNELDMIYKMLSDCLGVSKKPSHGQDFLALEDLNKLRQFIDDSIANQPYSKQLDHFIGYSKFVKDKFDYLSICFKVDFGSPEVDFNEFKDPFLIPCKNRWQIYNQWIENKQAVMRQQVDELMDVYQQHYSAHNILREADNVRLLKQVDIVGMTTTCAAKMRSTLEALENPIVVVEEAAEVLESHIIAALTDSCKHLILLGDHKQLRPTTADYTIEKDFQLGISLFERMVMNNVECHTLNVQHRMRPEISKLLKPTFYPDLRDSDSVKRYPDVSGVSKNLYFIDHREPEIPYGDSSKMNRHEAEFIIQLAAYLLNNNYKPEEITILAAYLGQVHTLKEEKNKCTHPFINDVHITSVDNFQGEENRIILLSLVRSNNKNKIGFLATDNRVCVALSRAREGFFIMGNMSLLCSASKIWKPIKSSLEFQKAIGSCLPLQCKNHPNFVTLVSKPSDFAKVPAGGCNRQCDAELECGHRCTRKCHGYDLAHEDYVCEETCNRSICGHPYHICLKKCFEDCGSCPYLVEKKFTCGHVDKIECSVKPEDSLCIKKIRIKPAHCEHIQEIFCHSRKNFKCTKDTERLLPCGHKGMAPLCHKVDIDSSTCEKKCNAKLKCGHVCTRKCHFSDSEHKKYKCEQPCLKSKSNCNYPQKHPKCSLPCYMACELCTIEIMTISDTCSHLNKIPCYETKVEMRCRKQCNTVLSCGHNCQKMCYEKCGPCSQKTYKRSACGHKLLVSCNERAQQSKCQNLCKKKLSCGHKCSRLCKEECICKERCNKVLSCGHSCIKSCNRKSCACQEVFFRKCGHWRKVKCTENLGEKCQQCQIKIITQKLQKL